MGNDAISMTGFGRARATLGSRTVGIEIRSLNHRGLDIKLRGYDLQLAPEIEAEILRLVRQTISRGSVTVNLREEVAQGQAAVLDPGWMRESYATLEAMRAELNLPGPLDMGTVVAYMALVKPGSTPEIAAARWPELAPGVEAALAVMCAMRAKEGAAIRADIEQRLANLRRLVEKIAELAEGVPLRAARRLEERLATLTSTVPAIEPARLAQEVAMLAERLDVSEELARLRAHLDHLAQILDGKGKDAPGRRIDFLVQEIGRECNTVGSKIQDAVIAALVIDGKAELEKLREQGQNIE
jgi:uncharacterized protein (TIGR00255 family)